MLADWRILRTFNRDIWLLTGAWAVSAVAYFGIQGVLLNLYLLRLGFGLEFIGVLIGTGQIVWAAAALPAGAIGRRMGLRGALILSHVVLAVGIGLFLMVEALPRSLWAPWLFGTWIVLWIGAALQAVNSNPYLMHVATPAERSHAFSTQGAVQVLMAFAGSILAGWLPGLIVSWSGGSLNDPAPYRLALWLAPALYLVGIAFRIPGRSIKLPVEAAATVRAIGPLRLFALLALVTFLQTASDGAVRAFFNVYLDVTLHVPIARIGAILGVGQLLSIVAIVYMPVLLSRWGTPRTLLWATLGLGLAMLPLGAFPHWAPATLAFIVIMATTSVSAAARALFSQEMVAAQWRTTSSAVNIVGLGVGWASAAAIGGYAVARVGFGGLFFVSAGLALMSAGVLWGYVRSGPRRARAAPNETP